MARSSSPGVERLFFPGLPESALLQVGNDHRLADSEPLKAMLEACERVAGKDDPIPDVFAD
jgi:hypothetical protein